MGDFEPWVVCVLATPMPEVGVARKSLQVQLNEVRKNIHSSLQLLQLQTYEHFKANIQDLCEITPFSDPQLVTVTDQSGHGHDLLFSSVCVQAIATLHKRASNDTVAQIQFTADEGGWLRQLRSRQRHSMAEEGGWL